VANPYLGNLMSRQIHFFLIPACATFQVCSVYIQYALCIVITIDNHSDQSDTTEVSNENQDTINPVDGNFVRLYHRYSNNRYSWKRSP